MPDELKAQLDALGDREPDTSDIPELSDEFWRNARRGPNARAEIRAAMATVRLRPDVVTWLSKKGPDVEASADQILRERMNAER